MSSSPAATPFPLFQQVTAQVQAGDFEGLGRSKIPQEIPCPTWEAFTAPLQDLLEEITPLESGSNRPLDFTFSDQFYSLVYFQVEQHTSARSLLKDLGDPAHPPLRGLPVGVPRSTFFDPRRTPGVDRGYLDYGLFDTPAYAGGKDYVGRLRKNVQFTIPAYAGTADPPRLPHHPRRTPGSSWAILST